MGYTLADIVQIGVDKLFIKPKLMFIFLGMNKKHKYLCPDCGGKMKSTDGESELICDSCKKSYMAKDCKMSDSSDDTNEPKSVEVTDEMIWSVSPSDLQTAKDAGFIVPFKLNANGALQGQTVGTTIGVYSYRQADGTVKRRLRAPEEVFKQESLDSLKLVPVTNGHPKELVTADNYKKYAVGSVGGLKQDAYRVYPQITIGDKGAIDAVMAGKKYLSCGYVATIVEKSGVWNGSAYDEVQTNIRYNHIAIVDTPRAGDEAVMHFDGLEIQQSQEFRMNKIIVDGVEYTCDEALAGLVAKLQTTQKDAMDKAVKVEAERDVIKSQLEKAQADHAELSKSLPTQIEAGVKSRLSVIEGAKAFGVEVQADQADQDVKIACLKATAPNLVLDGKSADYINAAFDLALEQRKNADVGRLQLADGVQQNQQPQAGVTQTDSAESARLQMIENLKKQSRGE